ncbi:hypothetical protein NLI96_g5025 [Meripilus lineatus]|uniref:Uncharacterized protein n=1 Tax=Meripilus lineatus TaxID=2056292 RepID=A0AAD5V3J5_9APHY|nr:hypothetical protein NLI96_g5025 [Physisporinus lineatus]
MINSLLPQWLKFDSEHLNTLHLGVKSGMSGERVDYGVAIVGAFSSIHLLGLFSTTIFLLALAPSPDSPSAKRPMVRAGHGRTSEAVTVTTDAAAVSPNRYETNARRWRGEK